MSMITFVNNMKELGVAKEAGVEEVIISPKGLSRFGELSAEQANELAKAAIELNIRPVLEWDSLATEQEMSLWESTISNMNLESFKAVRVQDMGALEIALEKTTLAIQMILETGNHNVIGLKTYKDYIGDRLDRMVLSIELTRDKLEEFKKELDCPIEFMVLGRILLFYTPRNLLSSMLPEDDEKRAKPVITAMGESEESPHKGFPVLENSRGTYMFHIKHQYLLEHLNELEFVDVLRVDLRFGADFEQLYKIKEIASGKLDGKEFKKDYPFDSIKGFYKVNRSDAIFKKLKNNRIQRKDENYIGEVLEIKKGSHQVIRLKGRAPLVKGSRLKFITPEGKVLSAPVIELKNTSLVDIDQAQPESLALMNYLGGVWVKSQVYLSE